MDNARERVRRRLVGYFQREGAPTQEEFAATVGYSQSWVSKILTRGPKLDDLDAIAIAMGVSVEQLVSARDLARHTEPLQGAPPAQEVHGATAQTGLLQNVPRAETLAAEVRQTITALSRLSAALDREAAATQEVSSRPVRRHRTAG